MVQLGAVKIYVAAVEARRKKERQGENSGNHQNWPTPGTGAVFSWLHGYLYFVTGFGVLFNCIFRFCLDGTDEITWFHFWLCEFHLLCESTIANKHNRYGNWRSMFTFLEQALYHPTASRTTRLLHTFLCGPFHGTKIGTNCTPSFLKFEPGPSRMPLTS